MSGREPMGMFDLQALLSTNTTFTAGLGFVPLALGAALPAVALGALLRRPAGTP